MSEAPLISVIVPTYNVGEYITACLLSIIDQKDFNDFEILCVDDASTDDTAQIVVELSKKYGKISFVRNEKNIGVSQTRNRALDLAAGKYIMFVDGDDLLSPKAMVTCFYEAEKQKTDLICFCADTFSSNGQYPFFSHERKDALAAINSGRYEHIAYVTNLWCLFYRRSFIEKYKVRFSNEKKIFEDWEFLWLLYSSTKSVRFIDRVLYYYRGGENKHSLTKGFSTRSWGFDLLLKAYQDGVAGFKSQGVFSLYEYICLHRAVEIFLHFFLKANEGYSKLKRDTFYFSAFLNGSPKYMIRKVIADNYCGSHLRVLCYVRGNKIADRVILYCMLNSKASEDIYTSYHGIRRCFSPLSQATKYFSEIGKCVFLGVRGVVKICVNVVRKGRRNG